LEEALADPATESPTTEALRSQLDAILVFSGDRHRDVSVMRRGDLAVFLRSDAAEARSAPTNKKAALRVQNGVRGMMWEY
jgi:hypothetical protein